MGDVGHAGERLAAEAEGLDAGEILVILQLALMVFSENSAMPEDKTSRIRKLGAHRRESFDGNRHVFFPDAMTIVCDLQQFQASVLCKNSDLS